MSSAIMVCYRLIMWSMETISLFRMDASNAGLLQQRHLRLRSMHRSKAKDQIVFLNRAEALPLIASTS